MSIIIKLFDLLTKKIKKLKVFFYAGVRFNTPPINPPTAPIIAYIIMATIATIIPVPMPKPAPAIAVIPKVTRIATIFRR